MTVRAKFRCQGVREDFYGDAKDDGTHEKSAEQVSFGAVYSSDPADPNHEWSKWTPCGQLSMTITNPACWGKFVDGKYYYLDITEAE